ncbi:MAG: exodeoxyribonuclease VII small subunit [Armatimonadota bacterium]
MTTNAEADNLDDLEQLPFEKALEELEAAVERLESGELSLDEQVKCYERGMKLIAVCRKRLKDASARIAKVVAAEGDRIEIEELESPE